VGISATFAISWTHPVSSWHVMQNMDLRLRDEQNKTAAWIRLVEGQNMTSTFRLLNPAETSQGITDTNVIYEGLPGENRDLVLTDTVTLHLAQSSINGTGQTIIMTPTVTFGPAAVGTYNIEFRVDNDDGSIQDDDVLGTFTILPAGCDVSLANISLSGTMTGTTNTDYAYSAAISPTNATTPISYTWSPEPQSGQGTTGATYNWSTAGQTAVAVAAENCGSFVVDGQTVALSSSPNPDLEISKRGPAIALAGQPITYTLTVTNNGAATAANPTITDTLPPGASYVGGGSLGGNTITWNLPGLSGYGAVTETVLVVSASSDITNTGYGVSADGGYSAQGSRSVGTQIVDAMVSISPTLTGTLSHGGDTEIVVPQGSVFARTEVAYRRLATTTYGLPAGATFKGRAFRLDAYQSSQPVTGLAFSEAISVTLTGLSDTNGALYYWTGSQWSASGVSCNPAGANTLTCSIDAPVPTTQFALLEATQSIYLPMIIKNYPPAGNYAQITGISLNGSTYEVAFTTFNFTPVLPGQHVHFFFNTVPPDQAGVPGAGPWQIYGGSSPFTGYSTADKPAAATQLCVLVANPDHSVQQNTGNCYNLP
jgi:uncharacterized repeat protein (TIGR01451 family)